MKSIFFKNKKEQLRLEAQLQISMSTVCLCLANSLLDEIKETAFPEDISLEEMKDLSPDELAERIVSAQITQIEYQAKMNVTKELKKLSDKY